MRKLLTLFLAVLTVQNKSVMKKYILICLIALACSEDDDPVDPHAGMGCLTGVIEATQERALIKCSTYREFLAGGNVNGGGTANWNNYTRHQWEKCDTCR